MKRVLFMLLLAIISSSHLLETYEHTKHRKDCYSQGLFFLNDTHIFESCGLYNKSFFHIMKYKPNPF